VSTYCLTGPKLDTVQTRSHTVIGRFAHLDDPREMPAYGIDEAAVYLQIPRATLRSWVVGRNYPVKGGERAFRPLILPAAEEGGRLLSFFNLVEAHVLAAIRRVHRVDLRAVRNAIDFLDRRYGTSHPLADQSFVTDGKDLFVQELGRLIAASASGQLAMRQVLDAHLQRIDRDALGGAERLYLFTRAGSPAGDPPRTVVVDPRVAFGRPVLAGTGIPTSVIAERFKAGESVEELAEDYGRSASEIEEALRCEQPVRTAA
jgi:uncharacterized protein (DUF433 family)